MLVSRTAAPVQVMVVVSVLVLVYRVPPSVSSDESVVWLSVAEL